MEECDVYVISDSSDHASTMDELLYAYACSTEANAANEFTNKHILKSQNPLSKLEKEKFIKHIEENNPYLYFDNISQSFKVHHMRYQEEMRISKSNNWNRVLRTYCEAYHTLWIDGTDKETHQLALLRMAEMKLKTFQDTKERQLLLNSLYFAYDIDTKQCDKINEELASKNAPIRLENKKETRSGKFRDKRYWMPIKHPN